MFFLGRMGQDLFHLGVGTMDGVDTGRSGNVRSPVLGLGNDGDDENSFDLDMETYDVATGRDNPTVSERMGGVL